MLVPGYNREEDLRKGEAKERNKEGKYL